MDFDKFDFLWDWYDEVLSEEKMEEILDAAFEECWRVLKRDPKSTLDNFVIYITFDYTHVLPPEGMTRIELLDFMIERFEELEMYERCGHLLKIKEKIEKQDP